MILTKMAASLSIGLIRRAITKTTAPSTFISKAISSPNPISPMFGTICKHNRSFSTDDSNHDDDDDSASYKPDPKIEWGFIVTMNTSGFYVPRPFNVLEGVRDQMGHPFAKEECGSLYEIKRIKDGLYVRIDFPGLGKDDVKITFEHHLVMIVKGEAEKHTESCSQGRRYEVRVHLAPRLYNTNEVHVDMKDGVLRIVLPRMVKDDVSDEK